MKKGIVLEEMMTKMKVISIPEEPYTDRPKMIMLKKCRTEKCPAKRPIEVAIRISKGSCDHYHPHETNCRSTCPSSRDTCSTTTNAISRDGDAPSIQISHLMDMPSQSNNLPRASETMREKGGEQLSRKRGP